MCRHGIAAARDPSYTFSHGRIGEIRPLIFDRRVKSPPKMQFVTPTTLVDVVEDAALLLELPVDRLSFGAGLVEPLAEIVVGLFEALAVADTVAERIADEEAEGGREQHPDRRGKASEVKVALHVDDKSVAQLKAKAKAKAVIHALERHQKRANRALIRAVGKKQYIGRMLAWKAHLRWMRLHIAYYKSWARPVHGRRKRHQRDLDELTEMAELAVRGEDHRAPGKKRLRNLMRLYARYSRSGRRGYWSVRSLLENKDTYRAQWKLAQFVIKRLKP